MYIFSVLLLLPVKFSPVQKITSLLDHLPNSLKWTFKTKYFAKTLLLFSFWT